MSLHEYYRRGGEEESRYMYDQSIRVNGVSIALPRPVPANPDTHLCIRYCVLSNLAHSWRRVSFITLSNRVTPRPCLSARGDLMVGGSWQ
jgi:hypothetical protein